MTNLDRATEWLREHIPEYAADYATELAALLDRAQAEARGEVVLCRNVRLFADGAAEGAADERAAIVAWLNLGDDKEALDAHDAWLAKLIAEGKHLEKP